MVVIGIAAAGFHGVRPGDLPDLYVPIAMQKAVRPTWDALEDRKFRWLNIFARLKPGMTATQAQAATNVVYRSILETELAGASGMRDPKDRAEFLNHKAQLKPAAQGINGLSEQFGKPLQVLMAMVGLVLLIACANVANLQLARTESRQHELAVRSAVGAGRLRLMRQLLTENILLAVIGGMAGLAVTAFAPVSYTHLPCQ